MSFPQFSREILRTFTAKHVFRLLYKLLKQSEQAGFILTLERLADHPELVVRDFVNQVSQLHLQPQLQVDHIELILERKLAIDVVDQDFLVTTKDSDQATLKAKVAVVALVENLRSAFNLGSIVRTSEALGLSKVIVTGYTPGPDNLKVKRASLGSEEWVEIQRVESSEEAIKSLKVDGYKIYAVETSSKAIELEKAAFEFPCVLVFGNEKFGLSQVSLSMADEIITLPMFGRKNSVNVAACAAVVFYEARRQWINRFT